MACCQVVNIHLFNNPRGCLRVSSFNMMLIKLFKSEWCCVTLHIKCYTLSVILGYYAWRMTHMLLELCFIELWTCSNACSFWDLDLLTLSKGVFTPKQKVLQMVLSNDDDDIVWQPFRLLSHINTMFYLTVIFFWT